MSDKVSPLENLKSFIELIGRLALGVLGICYALGLIILNAHFNRYGVYSLSLFQVNYITAGVWALVPVLLTCAISMCVIWMLLHFKSKFTKLFYGRYSLPAELRPKRVRRNQRASMLMGLGLLLILIGVAGSLDIAFSRSWANVLILAVMIGLLLVQVALDALDRRGRRIKPVFALSTVAVTLGLVLLALSFGKTVYGTIPAHLGGGAPNRVYLVVEQDQNIRALLEQTGVRFQPGLHLTESVPLLLTTDDEYVILISDATGQGERALSIRRDDLKGVIFDSVRK